MKLAPALLLLASVAIAPFTPAAADPPRPPNIVMIVSDDQAWGDFGFMNHPAIRTPHLDRLAAQGVAFTNGYVTTPLCRPSLATMLTGLYPHQHKICTNDPPEGQRRPVMWDFIKQAPALPRLLQQKGYRSFQTGKWWEGHHSSGGFTDGMTVKGRHGDDGLVIGRKTMKPMYDFLEAGKGEPFFLWYAPMLPHTPHDPPDRLLKKYQAATPDENTAKYYAMCEWFDETVGELLAYLDQKNLADNTIVLFVVDNGWTIDPPGTRPTARGGPRGKQTPYDGGLRTPVLIRWPGRLKPERRADLVSSVDLAPTLLAAAGLKPDPRMTGVNLHDVISGARPPREAVFGEVFVHTSVDVNDPAKNLTHRWIRKGDWKLIAPAEGGKVELYNVARDTAEKDEVSSANTEKVAELRKDLDAWWDGRSAKP